MLSPVRFSGSSNGEKAGWAALAAAGLAYAGYRALTKQDVKVQERPDGSLVINEGRGNFIIEHPELCDTAAIITNDKGERIVFQQVQVARPGEKPRLRRTVERLDASDKLTLTKTSERQDPKNKRIKAKHDKPSGLLWLLRKLDPAHRGSTEI